MRFSIIIPCYNVAPWVRACVESVGRAAERLGDGRCVEAVCVDDGSTDGTGELLDEMARTRKLVVIHQENRGVAAARNRGLEAATGEWVTFVDADDVVNPHWLEEAARLADSTDADLVRLGSVKGRSVPASFWEQKGGCAYEVFSGVQARAWMWETLTDQGFCWLCFIRRRVAEGFRFPALDCKEDSLALLGLADRVERCVQGMFAGYFYRIVNGSLMRRSRTAAQCVAYLTALGGLWRAQRSRAEAEGRLGAMRQSLRRVADHDVIEWIQMRNRTDPMPAREVRAAYRRLAEIGAFEGTVYADLERHRLGFVLWRLTGQTWPIAVVGGVFRVAGRLIRREW